MNVCGNCKLPSSPARNGLNRIQHLNMKMKITKLIMHVVFFTQAFKKLILCSKYTFCLLQTQMGKMEKGNT
jgi:hypothetical protein